MSEQAILDLAIIGSGPAALSAALYAARAGLLVQLYERTNPGGLLATIPAINNYPGFTGAGAELSQQILNQLSALDISVRYGECTEVKCRNNVFVLTIDDELVQAHTVIIATGSKPRELSFQPSRPVSYCALCDGDLARGKNVAVIGGANSATQEAIYLAGLAKNVTLITHSALKSDQTLQDALRKYPNIKILENTEPTPELLEPFDHIFVYIGQFPASDCLRPLAEHLLEGDKLLDQNGYILTKQNFAGIPETDNHAGADIAVTGAGASVSSATSVGAEASLASATFLPHETIIPGLFAAGDVRAGSIHQVITAAGDGAMAAIEAISYLKSRKA